MLTLLLIELTVTLHKDPDARKQYFREHYKRTRQRRISDKLEAAYGITLEQYELLLASQDGRCAICRELPKSKRRFAVDHNHDTGKIRALLCTLCNRYIVFSVEKYPALVEKAHEYLRQHA